MSVKWCGILKYELLPLTKDFLTAILCFLGNCYRSSNSRIRHSIGQRACREKSWHLEYRHLDMQPERKIILLNGLTETWSGLGMHGPMYVCCLLFLPL